jgi:hypothetical protein
MAAMFNWMYSCFSRCNCRAVSTKTLIFDNSTLRSIVVGSGLVSLGGMGLGSLDYAWKEGSICEVR